MKLLQAELALILKLIRYDAERQRKRVALAVLAIGWGTLSIILLLSFGEGMKHAFHKGKRGLGDSIGVLWPGATTRAFMGLPSGRAIKFRDEDGGLLTARIPSLGDISREYARWGTVTRGRKTVNVRIRGVDASFGDLRNQVSGPGGRFINERDVFEKRRSIFLGEELAKDLFGDEPPLGQGVQINQSTFVVVGVAQPKIMMGMYSGPDKKQATISATTFKALFSDAHVENFVYRPLAPELGDEVKAEIYRVLGVEYHFDPEDRRALSIWDTREDQRIMANMALGIQLFLGIIGVLTLMVGGMGVANIMYAVVKERTREIGVKMALGAKVRQVMAPFVIEALFTTIVGGILGTVVSLLLMGGIALLPLEGEAFDFLGRPTFSPSIALATTLVLGTIGVLAGYFPARLAATVNPAESLRYE